MTPPVLHARRTLASVTPENTVSLREIHGGHRVKTRLAALGLLPGTPVRVIRNQAHGGCIVAVRGSRLVLGRGLAHKMDVET